MIRKKITPRKQAIKDLRSKGISKINGRTLKKCKNIEINTKYLEIFGVILGLKDPRKKKKITKKQNYDRYLRSKKWRAFRDAILYERGYFCECCNKKYNSLHIHHIHYNNFKKELREDVLVLCQDCHFKMHNKIKQSPYSLERLKKLVNEV